MIEQTLARQTTGLLTTVMAEILEAAPRLVEAPPESEADCSRQSHELAQDIADLGRAIGVLNRRSREE